MNLSREEAWVIVSHLMRHDVQGELFDLQSDILLFGTPKRHTSKLHDTPSDKLGWQIWLGQSGAIQPPCLFFLLLME